MSEELTVAVTDLKPGDVVVSLEPPEDDRGIRVTITRGADVLTAKLGDGYTQEQLSAAFDLVKNPKGWKLHIDKLLTRQQVDEVTESRLSEAISYFTGSLAEIFPEPGRPGYVRVQAAGYYACIGS